jgi:hypothetical protein
VFSFGKSPCQPFSLASSAPSPHGKGISSSPPRAAGPRGCPGRLRHCYSQGPPAELCARRTSTAHPSCTTRPPQAASARMRAFRLQTPTRAPWAAADPPSCSTCAARHVPSAQARRATHAARPPASVRIAAIAVQ